MHLFRTVYDVFVANLCKGMSVNMTQLVLEPKESEIHTRKFWIYRLESWLSSNHQRALLKLCLNIVKVDVGYVSEFWRQRSYRTDIFVAHTILKQANKLSLSVVQYLAESSLRQVCCASRSRMNLILTFSTIYQVLGERCLWVSIVSLTV